MWCWRLHYIDTFWKGGTFFLFFLMTVFSCNLFFMIFSSESPVTSTFHCLFEDLLTRGKEAVKDTRTPLNHFLLLSVYRKVVLFRLDFWGSWKPFGCAGNHLLENHTFPWDACKYHICCRTHRKQNCVL